MKIIKLPDNIKKSGDKFIVTILHDKKELKATCKSLEDAKIKLEEFKQFIEENPNNIYYTKNYYRVKKIFDKNTYEVRTSTFEAAKQKLTEFEKTIENIKNNKKIELANLEIVRNNNGVAIIPLKNDQGAIVDYAKVSDEDWFKCMEYCWNKTTDDYANGQMLMHCFILGKPEDKKHVIDHINHDRLDNTRENLRFANRSQNSQNIVTKNEYKGISWLEKNKKWQAKSGCKYLGSFEDLIEAAKTYDTYAFLKYGKNALTNGLVKYEDVKDMDINTFSKTRVRDLPKCICKTNNNTYRVQIKYKKQKFDSTCDTLEEAEKKVQEFQKQIEEIKLKERTEHENLEILRDIDGNAIINVKDKNKNVVDHFIVDDDVWHLCMQIAWSKTDDYYTTVRGILK